MNSRSVSRTLAVQESFAFSRMTARSTEPEFFTFDRIPAQATAVPSVVPVRPRKRCSRVMYPPKVRMHLPPPEKMSQAKRWLLILGLVVLLQIYFEDPCVETDLSGVDRPASDLQGLSVLQGHCAAEQPASPLLSAASTHCEQDQTTTCPVPDQNLDRSFEQSAGNSYVVALLVYHRLGGDN